MTRTASPGVLARARHFVRHRDDRLAVLDDQDLGAQFKRARVAFDDLAQTRIGARELELERVLGRAAVKEAAS